MFSFEMYFQCFFLGIKILLISLFLINSKYNWWKTLLITISAITPFFVAFYFAAQKMSIFSSYIVFAVFLFIFSSIFITQISKRKWYSSFTIAMNACVYSATIGIVLLALSKVTNLDWLYYTLDCVFLVPLLGYFKHIYLPFHEEIEEYSPKSFATLFIISMCAFLIVSSSLIRSMCFTKYLYIPTILSLAISTFIFLYQIGLNSLIKNYKTALIVENDTKVLQKQLSALSLQNAVIQENERKLAVYRHDAKHYVNTLRTLLENGQLDEAKKMLNHSEANISSTKGITYSNNLILNSVIVGYQVLCEQNHVKLDALLPIPENISLNIYDVAVFLSNCVDNAYNATLKIPEEDRYISVHTQVTDGFVILEVKNSFNENDSVHIANIDDLNEIHGIGSYSIKHFADQHNIILNYSTVNNTYTLSALFPRPKL